MTETARSRMRGLRNRALVNEVGRLLAKDMTNYSIMMRGSADLDRTRSEIVVLLEMVEATDAPYAEGKGT